MFSWLENEAFLFEDNDLAYNAHTLGASPMKFKSDQGLKNMFEVIAVSNVPGVDGKEFVAAIEGIKYPFFAT